MSGVVPESAGEAAKASETLGLVAAIQAHRATASAALRAGQGGTQSAQAFSAALSATLGAHASEVLGRHAAGAGVAVVAVGGLGRGLQFPHSDIDLVVLVGAGERASGEPSEAHAELMRELLHPLWDAKLKVNAVLRSLDEWLSLAVDDLTACTALLDVACIAGDEALVKQLLSQAHARFFGDERAEFMSRINEEVRTRHSRYGATVYKVEPDLKHGPGGLRDLSGMDWALLATHGTADLGELERRGIIGEHVLTILDDARDALVRLRTALHLAAGRAQDRLVFRFQEAMPPILGMTSGGPGEVADETLVAAIEAFMQDYYRAANDVARHGVRVFAKCMPPREDAAAELRIDERFVVVNDRLHHDGETPFDGRPMLAIDAIEIAQDFMVRISARTADAIAEALAAPEAARLVDDPEAQRRFLSLLVDNREAEGRSALQDAFDLGLIERLVPEFAASRGRMQHDSFHVYTVDQHSLYAVEFVKALRRGEHRKDYPLGTALALGLDDIRPLCLATLLHDVGKPFGDQCVQGARIMRLATQRAELEPAVQERLALLVEEHLTMPLLSQKRDLSDPLLIQEFAQRVGDKQTLTELYLLSLVDMANVSPDFLTNWKLTLLDELFLATLAHLRQGHSPVPRPERPGEPQGMPARYYSLFDADLRQHHLGLIEQARIPGRDLVLDIQEGAAHVRLTILCADRAGLLADITAALFELSVDVVAAEIFSVPGDSPLVLDVFRVDSDERHPMGLEFAARARELLRARALGPAGATNAWADPAVDPGAQSGRVPGGRALRTPTQVRFSEDTAGTRTLVEVETPQRPGALARVTAAFAACGVDIQVARLGSDARMVHDVFYVDRLDPETRAQLEARLHAFLGHSA